MEPTTINRNEIITLILADMRSRKLIMGLEATGLATDDFNTNLVELICSKMDIAKEHEIPVFNWYEDTIYDLLDTDLNKFRDHQVFLAVKLYDALKEKREQLQKKDVLKDDTKFTFLQWIWGKRFDN
ncbi:hypothetical protein [Cytophaga aurantiaca]|uniref:hypothetical protein n=1 Tax=Cytophaga aurantiaca TaxID=29530 RepID=UPI00037232E3|nr:hypothetical protein [Cytophaga aurantiaca]